MLQDYCTLSGPGRLTGLAAMGWAALAASSQQPSKEDRPKGKKSEAVVRRVGRR